MKQIHGGVTAAPGFKAAGIHAGLKDSHQKDFAIILSDSQATAAGVFTQNRVCAAPVTLCRDHIRNQVANAIVINSKNANACTGHQGLEDAYSTAKLAGETLGVNSNLRSKSAANFCKELIRIFFVIFCKYNFSKREDIFFKYCFQLYC